MQEVLDAALARSYLADNKTEPEDFGPARDWYRYTPEPLYRHTLYTPSYLTKRAKPESRLETSPAAEAAPEKKDA